MVKSGNLDSHVAGQSSCDCKQKAVGANEGSGVGSLVGWEVVGLKVGEGVTSPAH